MEDEGADAGVKKVKKVKKKSATGTTPTKKSTTSKSGTKITTKPASGTKIKNGTTTKATVKKVVKKKDKVLRKSVSASNILSLSSSSKASKTKASTLSSKDAFERALANSASSFSTKKTPKKEKSASASSTPTASTVPSFGLLRPSSSQGLRTVNKERIVIKKKVPGSLTGSMKDAGDESNHDGNHTLTTLHATERLKLLLEEIGDNGELLVELSHIFSDFLRQKGLPYTFGKEVGADTNSKEKTSFENESSEEEEEDKTGDDTPNEEHHGESEEEVTPPPHYAFKVDPSFKTPTLESTSLRSRESATMHSVVTEVMKNFGIPSTQVQEDSGKDHLVNQRMQEQNQTLLHKENHSRTETSELETESLTELPSRYQEVTPLVSKEAWIEPAIQSSKEYVHKATNSETLRMGLQSSPNHKEELIHRDQPILLVHTGEAVPSEFVQQLQPVALTQPAQPAQPVQQPVQLVQPVQPIQPVQPVQPVQSAQPVQPIQPVQPVQPVQPIQPIQQVQPVQLVQPIHPVPTIQPVQPILVQAVQLVQPVQPVQLTPPLQAVQPVQQAQPLQPGIQPVPLQSSIQPPQPIQLEHQVQPVQLVQPVPPVQPVQPVPSVDQLATSTVPAEHATPSPPEHQTDESTKPSISSVKELSSEDKAALREKALERISKIKARLRERREN